jgi:AcrR family transcriptional regulator
MARRTDDLDRRARQTRESILGAFARLAFERRYEAIRIADLIAAAGVGRATFYEHFRGKDELALAAMEPILLPLAGAATGRANQVQVRSILDHIWQQRAAGRAILNSAAEKKLKRRLAAMIEARLEAAAPETAPASMVAMGAAAAQLAMLRIWIAGEVSCSTDILARQMIECSKFVRAKD